MKSAGLNIDQLSIFSFVVLACETYTLLADFTFASSYNPLVLNIFHQAMQSMRHYINNKVYFANDMYLIEQVLFANMHLHYLKHHYMFY